MSTTGCSVTQFSKDMSVGIVKGDSGVRVSGETEIECHTMLQFPLPAHSRPAFSAASGV